MASNLQYIDLMDFIAGKKTAAERLAAIEICIDNAIILIGKVTTNPMAHISEYQLDDSMVRLRTSYRSIKDIQESIGALEVMAEHYKNQLRGRQMVLKDIRTFR